MALKSETLQTPQISVVGSSNNINDEKLSGEDLEDGEIFDDEDETPESNAPAGEPNKQSNTDKTNNVTSKSSDSSKENKSPDSKAASTKTTVNNSKNEQHYLPPWKNNNNNNINTVTSADKKSNSTNNENVTGEKRSREKKKKKKRQRDEDNEDDEKRHKEKRVKKHHDKDVADSLSNKTLPLADEHGNEGNDDEDDEDDDEMLFVRGASPTMNHHPHPKRHNRHPSREEEENDDHAFDEDDDYMDDDEDIDEEYDDEEGDDRRRGNRLNDPLARLDRAARRERLAARGKRRGRGGTTGTSKRRKDDGDVCIFYMQGKCHKGNDCPFSHDAMPHRKLELCKFYLMDCCTKKDKCLYMHSEFPCKYFHMGLKCYANKNCKFSHGKLTDTMRQVFVKTFGPINRSKEFPNKKGAPSKHNRPQDGSGAGNEFPRGRGEGNRRGGPGGGGGGGVGGPDNKRGDQNQKKIPSLFDIKVSIPDEMLNNHSDSDGGNHTPMPSPPVMHNNVSDSSRSPPPQSHMPSGNMSPSMAAAAARKRRKERKMDRPGRKGANLRGDRNNDDNMGLSGNIRGRQSMMMGNNESSWDEIMDEYQNMARFANVSAGGGNSDNTIENNLMNNMNINNFNNSDDLNMDFTSDYNQFDNNSSFNIVNNTDNINSNSRPNNINSNSSSKCDSTIATDSSNNSSMEDDRGEGGLQIVENNDEFFPSHLPKKQRELFLRIRQQQRHHESDETSYKQEDGEEDTNETHTDRNSCDSTSLKTENGEDKQGAGGNLTDIFDSKSSNKHHDDQNWYSSDEEDDQPAATPALGSNNSITALLQNLVRLNSSSSNTSTSTTTVSHSNSNNFSSVQSTSSTVGSSVSDISAAGISNMDFDVNVVSELLSKVKQCIQTNTTTSTTPPIEKKTVRDPRLRSDVGPSGDSPGSSSTPLPTVVPPATTLNQNHNSSAGNNDCDLRLNNSSGTRGVGGGDMDLRNLPFKPAPVHSAANEIDASINSHVPLPYKLLPVHVAKPDYSTVQANSKVGAADPRLRKSLRISEEPSSVVSSRDPRHRLIEDVSKPKPPPVAPLPQISDPRQRARMAAAMSSSNMNDEQQQMSAASLMMSHLQPSYPMLPTGGPPDMGMMCPPTPRIDDDGSPPYMTQIPQMPPVPVTRPTDPRQRHSQMNQQHSSAQPNPMFDPLMNTRQPPNFLAQNNDPRSRPPGMGQPNLSNVFPGSLRSNNPNMNNGPYNYK